MEGIRYGRKRRGIKKELQAKLKDWLASIEDEEVRKLAEKNTIVTGGSIASMLLGEKINDFDVYFRNLETAQVVAEYYVDKFNYNKRKKLEAEQRKELIDYEPKVVTPYYFKDTNCPLVDTYDHEDSKPLAARYEEAERLVADNPDAYEKRLMIWMQSAGIASEEQSEYKYFELHPESELEAFAETVGKDYHDKQGEKYRPVFLSQNAITLSDKIQIVIRFYGEPEEIHNNYDFIHAMNYYDHGKDELVLKLEALEALMSRSLVYRGSLYPVASIFRMKKFLERGWRITAGEQMKIMWQISELDLTDFNTIREQLCGVDMAYMYELIQVIKDVDPEKINSSYIATIIDRIFD